MWMIALVFGLVLLAGQAEAIRSWDFDRVEAGALPEGWKVEATGQDKAAAEWQVVNAGDYIPGTGGVGLWTKADAATAFDDLTVVSR